MNDKISSLMYSAPTGGRIILMLTNPITALCGSFVDNPTLALFAPMWGMVGRCDATPWALLFSQQPMAID